MNRSTILLIAATSASTLVSFYIIYKSYTFFKQKLIIKRQQSKYFEYICKNCVEGRENEYVTELREITRKHPLSFMATSPDQLQFLNILIRILNPRKALDIGVYTGLSSLVMALAMPEDGKIIACDITDEYAKLGMPYWKLAGVENKIDFRINPAVQTLQELLTTHEGNFDFAYIDADKENLVDYYEYCIKLMRRGGVIAIDNMLWFGRVLEEHPKSESTIAIKRLTSLLKDDKRVIFSMLSIGDGLALVMKQ